MKPEIIRRGRLLRTLAWLGLAFAASAAVSVQLARLTAAVEHTGAHTAATERAIANLQRGVALQHAEGRARAERIPPATTLVDICRRHLEDQLSAGEDVARGARIVPSIRDGQANGFKIYAIRPSSIYATLGFRNGDTIEALNGHELTTPDRALEVYARLRDASFFDVDLQRDGRSHRIVVLTHDDCG